MRTIGRVFAGTDNSVTFEIADALLVALDAVALWDQPPLCEHLSPAPDRSSLINPITPAQDAARRRAIQRSASDYGNP